MTDKFVLKKSRYFQQHLLEYILSGGDILEWLTTIRKSIEYIEDHLAENITPELLANQVSISPYMLSKGFAIMTGYSISEYI